MEGTARRRRKLALAIPASLVDDSPHLRDKTIKVGIIGRAAAIFRVEEIIIYRDKPRKDQRKAARFISQVLSYMETPQYLRKRLVKLKPNLRYVGVLPPLRTPNHPTQNRAEFLKKGEIREGIVISTSPEGVEVDVGVERPVFVPKAAIEGNTRVTVKITDLGEPIKAILMKRKDVRVYWGYKIVNSGRSLEEIVKKRDFDLLIATSKYGRPILNVLPNLKKEIDSSRSILLLFGSPSQGLYQIAEKEGWNLEEGVHYVLNTIPLQGTETVRTEEAVLCTLAILNPFIE